jgi:hypothetical protein
MGTAQSGKDALSCAVVAPWQRGLSFRHLQGGCAVQLTTETRLAHLRRFAFWLDAGIGVPGTSLRFGLDPLLGLVPGLGDAAGALLSAWILVAAIRLGASRATLGRMAANIAVDALIGVVPLVGDVFDFVWKANLRNVDLLELHMTDSAAAARRDGMFVATVVGAILLLCGALVLGGVLVVWWAIRVVRS